METNKLYASKKIIIKSIIVGASIGIIIALLEYLFRLYTQNRIELFPLLVRALINGSTIFSSITIYEILLHHKFARKKFAYIVLVKALSYTIIISFWLVVVNTTWFTIHIKTSFFEGLIRYVLNDIYLINLLSVFIILVIGIGLYQVNSLHRKEENW